MTKAYKTGRKSKRETGGVAVVSPITEQMRKAALVLALNGYVKGQRAHTGAPGAAAKQAGVSRYTVYCWLQIPEFVQEIEDQKAEVNTLCWNTVVKNIRSGSSSAAFEAMDRINWEKDPRVLMLREKLKHDREMEAWRREEDEKAKQRDHQRRLELMKAKALLGEALDDEPTEYRVTYTDAGDAPPPEERH